MIAAHPDWQIWRLRHYFINTQDIVCFTRHIRAHVGSDGALWTHDTVGVGFDFEEPAAKEVKP